MVNKWGTMGTASYHDDGVLKQNLNGWLVYHGPEVETGLATTRNHTPRRLDHNRREAAYDGLSASVLGLLVNQSSSWLLPSHLTCRIAVMYVLAESPVLLLESGTAPSFLELGARREHLAGYKMRDSPTSELKSI